MTTMHLIPIAPAPPRTPGKLEGTLTTLSPAVAAARCVFLPLQPAVVGNVPNISESEMQSSAKRLQGLVSLSSEGNTTNNQGSNGNNNNGKCKRKINFGGLSYTLPKPQSAAVVRRNERERNRVRKVNVGFAKLRDHVPGGGKNKKLSKVETLRSAVDYIRKLQKMLEEDGAVVQQTGSSDADVTTAAAALDTLHSNAMAARLDHGSVGSVGSVCSTSDSVSIVDSMCSPASSVDTLGHSPEHYPTDDSPSPPPSSTGPVSPQTHSGETDFFDFTAWLVQS